MKFLKFFCFLFLALLISCSPEEDDPNVDLVGTWVLTERLFSYHGLKEEAEEVPITHQILITIADDNTITWYDPTFFC